MYWLAMCRPRVASGWHACRSATTCCRCSCPAASHAQCLSLLRDMCRGSTFPKQHSWSFANTAEQLTVTSCCSSTWSVQCCHMHIRRFQVQLAAMQATHNQHAYKLSLPSQPQTAHVQLALPREVVLAQPQHGLRLRVVQLQLVHALTPHLGRLVHVVQVRLQRTSLVSANLLPEQGLCITKLHTGRSRSKRS